MTTVAEANKACDILRSFLNEDTRRSITFWCRDDKVKLESSKNYGIDIKDAPLFENINGMTFVHAMNYIRTKGGMIRQNGAFFWIRYTKVDNNFWYCNPNGKLVTDKNGMPLRISLSGNLLDCMEWQYARDFYEI